MRLACDWKSDLTNHTTHASVDGGGRQRQWTHIIVTTYSVAQTQLYMLMTSLLAASNCFAIVNHVSWLCSTTSYFVICQMWSYTCYVWLKIVRDSAKSTFHWIIVKSSSSRNYFQLLVGDWALDWQPTP